MVTGQRRSQLMKNFMNQLKNLKLGWATGLFTAMLASTSAFANESNLHVPDLNVTFNMFGNQVAGETILWSGIVVGILVVAAVLVRRAKRKLQLQQKRLMLQNQVIMLSFPAATESTTTEATTNETTANEGAHTELPVPKQAIGDPNIDLNLE